MLLVNAMDVTMRSSLEEGENCSLMSGFLWHILELRNSSKLNKAMPELN